MTKEFESLHDVRRNTPYEPWMRKLLFVRSLFPLVFAVTLFFIWLFLYENLILIVVSTLCLVVSGCLFGVSRWGSDSFIAYMLSK